MKILLGQFICILRIISLSFLVWLIRFLEVKGLCVPGLFNDIKLLVPYHDDVKLAVQNSITGSIFAAYALAFKASLGVVTLVMVTALYIKVRIIYEQVGVSTWS